MKKKLRVIILLSCVAGFFIIAPVLVTYSMGYRLDFETMKIVATGGIYIRTFPTADQLTVDSAIYAKPGFLVNSFFVQSLLPKTHTLEVTKEGYHNYFKTLPVLENQVTKLENVLLLKKIIIFNEIQNKADYFSITPNKQNILVATINPKNVSFNYSSLNGENQDKIFSLALILGQQNEIDIKWSEDSRYALIIGKTTQKTTYHLYGASLPQTIPLAFLDKTVREVSFDPQNSEAIFYIKNNNLYTVSPANKKPENILIASDVVSYKISGQTITFISSKGLVFTSSLLGDNLTQTSLKAFPVNLKNKYEISFISGNLFLKENNQFFKFNTETKELEEFKTPITNSQIAPSPDGKNVIYQNNGQIYLYSLADKKYAELFSGENIDNFQWLNNDYIVFTSGDKIIISEIDYRGNINAITLPQKIALADSEINIKNPSTFFDSSTGKIYILTNNQLLVSEKITP